MCNMIAKRRDPIAAASFSLKEKGVFKREKVKQKLHLGEKENKGREPKTKGEQGNVTILELNYSY